jgi:hypothetical protein
MAYGEGTASQFNRQRDDETQAYLTEFFLEISSKNVGGFQDLVHALTAEEHQKLASLG